MGRQCSSIIVSIFLFAMGPLAFGSETRSERAFGNIHFGRLYVHPKIGVEATYDDNVFLLGQEKQDDVMFTISPGVDLDFTREGKSARLNYLATIARFLDNTDFNYENHHAEAAVDLQFTNGLTIFAGDVFRRSHDRLTYEERPLIKRDDNTADVKVGYAFSDRLSFRVDYNRRMVDYKMALWSVYDRDENLVSGTAFYRIFNRVSLLGQLQYIEIDYDQEGTRFDSEGVGGWLGVTGELTPKVVALIKGGWHERDYDGPREDFEGGVFSVDIVHRVSPTLTLTIGGSREVIESAYLTNNYFVGTQGRVGLQKRIGPKLIALLSAYYANNDYPEATPYPGGIGEREDDVWGARVALRYNIRRWLSTRLSYTREERDSNQNMFDYDDNRVSLGVSAVF